MYRPSYTEFMEQARAADPHGRESNHSIERRYDMEMLEFDIYEIEHVEDVKPILTKMLDLIRSA